MGGAGPVRVMLVDDSAIIRRLLGTVLDADPGITVVGQAANGQEALDRLDAVDPDVVVLDIEMPVMDGLATLPQLKARRPRLPVVMFSTLTERGASATLDALTRGADDYVTKPSNTGSFAQTATQITALLVPKLKALHHRSSRPSAQPGRPAGTRPAVQQPGAAAPALADDAGTAGRPLSRRAVEHAAILAQPIRTIAARTGPPPSLVVIGVSTGGPNALAELVPSLPATLPVPVLITQHMPPIFTRLLAERLDAQSPARVAEATEGAMPRAGEIWIAPGGRHLVVRSRAGQISLHLDDGPPVHSCKPAVDPMFTTAVQVLGDRVLGVVLTGMGNDGLDGCRAIAGAGGRVVVQDEATSVVWGMPGIVARAGVAERILPLGEIADAITDITTHPVGRRAPGQAAAPGVRTTRLPATTARTRP